MSTPDHATTPTPGSPVRTRMRPTSRGWWALALAVLLWAGGEITGLTAGRTMAVALLLTSLVSVAHLVLTRAGLRLQRHVLDQAVPVGGGARIDMQVRLTPLVGALGTAHGRVREHLPEALGGDGDVQLAPSMPHHLVVARRGIHELGPCEVHLRDVFGLWTLRCSFAAPATVTGLPRVEPIGSRAARSAGVARAQDTAAANDPGVGELGVIPRPYADGDDIRRIHWRASARVGRLMTREDEPSRDTTAAIVLDTRRIIPPPPESVDDLLALQDRIVEFAASLLAALTEHGWEVRVLDAGGDEITRIDRRSTNDASPVGRSVDATAARASLVDLAGIGFGDDPGSTSLLTDHAAGSVHLVIALGPDLGQQPFAGLELDRFAARAPQRLAIGLRPDGRSRTDSSRSGRWLLLRTTLDTPLEDVLLAADATERERV